MKKKYYNVYSGYSTGSDLYSVELIKTLNEYYNIHLTDEYYYISSFVDETEYQKNTRLAKEKAEKRNNKIDSILSDI